MEAIADGTLRGVRERVHAASHMAHECARLGTVAPTEEGARMVSRAREASINAARLALALDDALRSPLGSSMAKAAEEAIQAAEAAFATSRAILTPCLPVAIDAMLARQATHA